MSEDLDAALRALADPNRRRILSVVRDQPRAVGEIAQALAMSQQAVSFHLRVLRGAGLVSERHERTRHLFVVRTDGLEAVRDFLDGFWPTHLAALKRAQAVLGRMHDLQVLIDRVRDVQASIAPPQIAVWGELDALVIALDEDCRRLHARYMRSRDRLVALATGLSTRSRSSIRSRRGAATSASAQRAS